jgi:uncharacterized protein YbbC (DUF1343 family)
MRHGMTVGELARLFNNQFGIGANLRVIKMVGWKRSMIWPDTGLQWVQTSPNIPEWSTTVVYPCTGLTDSIGLNGGIGTTKPFKYVGGQNVDAYGLANELNARNIPGVYFRPAYWTPFFGALSGDQLAGVELDVFDPKIFPSVRTAVEIATAVRAVSPRTLKTGEKTTATDWGTDTFASALQAGRSAQQIEAQWAPALQRFLAIRQKYLLYR